MRTSEEKERDVIALHAAADHLWSVQKDGVKDPHARAKLKVLCSELHAEATHSVLRP